MTKSRDRLILVIQDDGMGLPRPSSAILIEIVRRLFAIGIRQRREYQLSLVRDWMETIGRARNSVE
jgi:hypothetical protein